MLTMTSRGEARVEPNAVILLVEDDIEIGGHLCKTLETNNYRVRWCVNGLSALRAMDEQKPDLILLDVGLPDTDGFALCRELRFLRKEVPIVMVTAADSDIDVVMGSTAVQVTTSRSRFPAMFCLPVFAPTFAR
jgi:DNA-binding response OmpR family regulator